MKRRRFKTIRVFVSSTFKDLKEERDYLFLHAFRELETCVGGLVPMLHLKIKPCRLAWKN